MADTTESVSREGQEAHCRISTWAGRTDRPVALAAARLTSVRAVPAVSGLAPPGGTQAHLPADENTASPEAMTPWAGLRDREPRLTMRPAFPAVTMANVVAVTL